MEIESASCQAFVVGIGMDLLVCNSVQANVNQLLIHNGPFGH